MKKYRYIGAFPLVLRSANGEVSRLLRYGDEFNSSEKINNRLIIVIEEN